jgi:hypothetical protein
MGPGETIALVAVAGVALGALITIGTTLHKWIDYKRRRAELELQARSSARVDRSEAHQEMLEERVRVLERIATDRGHDVAFEIEALRDRMALPAGSPDVEQSR